MNTAQNGKGDKPRKGANPKAFRDGWDAIKTRNHKARFDTAASLNGKGAGTTGNTSGDPVKPGASGVYSD